MSQSCCGHFVLSCTFDLASQAIIFSPLLFIFIENWPSKQYVKTDEFSTGVLPWTPTATDNGWKVVIDAKIKRLGFLFFFKHMPHQVWTFLLAMQADLVRVLFRSCKLILTFWSNYVPYTCTFDDKTWKTVLTVFGPILPNYLITKITPVQFWFNISPMHFLHPQMWVRDNTHPSPWWFPIIINKHMHNEWL